MSIKFQVYIYIYILNIRLFSFELQQNIKKRLRKNTYFMNK